MEKNKIPEFIIVDIQQCVIKFISIYKPTTWYLSSYDIEFVNKVLSEIWPAFTNLYNSERILRNNLSKFIDGSVLYSEELYNPNKLVDAVCVFCSEIVSKLESENLFLNGNFSFKFKIFGSDSCIVFERL